MDFEQINNVQLMVFDESTFERINEERMQSVSPIYLQMDTEEIEYTLKEEMIIVQRYLKYIHYQINKISFGSSMDYQHLKILSNTMQLIKRYFLRWSPIQCLNIEQICITSYFIALKLQNVHLIPQLLQRINNLLKKQELERCTFIGEESYPEVERDFLERIYFNIQIESLYDVIESLMLYIKDKMLQKNEEYRLIEQDAIILSYNVFQDYSLIFLNNQTILGLCCVLIALENKNACLEMLLPPDVVNLIQLRNDIIAGIKDKIRNVVAYDNKTMLEYFCAFQEVSQQKKFRELNQLQHKNTSSQNQIRSETDLTNKPQPLDQVNSNKSQPLGQVNSNKNVDSKQFQSSNLKNNNVSKEQCEQNLTINCQTSLNKLQSNLISSNDTTDPYSLSTSKTALNGIQSIHLYKQQNAMRSIFDKNDSMEIETFDKLNNMEKENNKTKYLSLLINGKKGKDNETHLSVSQNCIHSNDLNDDEITLSVSQGYTKQPSQNLIQGTSTQEESNTIPLSSTNTSLANRSYGKQLQRISHITDHRKGIVRNPERCSNESNNKDNYEQQEIDKKGKEKGEYYKQNDVRKDNDVDSERYREINKIYDNHSYCDNKYDINYKNADRDYNNNRYRDYTDKDYDQNSNENTNNNIKVRQKDYRNNDRDTHQYRYHNDTDRERERDYKQRNLKDNHKDYDKFQNKDYFNYKESDIKERYIDHKISKSDCYGSIQAYSSKRKESEESQVKVNDENQKRNYTIYDYFKGGMRK